MPVRNPKNKYDGKNQEPVNNARAITAEEISQWCKWTLYFPTGSIIEGILLRSAVFLAPKYLAIKNPENEHARKAIYPKMMLEDNTNRAIRRLFLL